MSVYGISMPFSFYYSNNNSSFNFPHLSFHIDPTYKNWRGHFGRSNMAMSSYIMNCVVRAASDWNTATGDCGSGPSTVNCAMPSTTTPQTLQHVHRSTNA